MDDYEIFVKTHKHILDYCKAQWPTTASTLGLTCAFIDFSSSLATLAIQDWEKRKRRGRVPWQSGRRQSVGARENAWRKKRRDRLPFYRRLVKALENCHVQIGLGVGHG